MRKNQPSQFWNWHPEIELSSSREVEIIKSMPPRTIAVAAIYLADLPILDTINLGHILQLN